MRLASLVGMLAALAFAGAAGAAGPRFEIESSAPRAVALADAFDYVVEATVPAADGTTAELRADVGPFTVLDAEPVEWERRGDVVVLRLVRRLACVDERCVGKERSRSVVLPAPVVESRTGAVAGTPTSVVVRGRIPPATVRVSLEAFRADTTVPPVSRTRPTAIVVVLAAVAAVALLAGIAFLVAGLRRRSVSEGDALGRAIRLLRESAGRSETDRRRAADHLACVAGEHGSVPLTASASAVAWSPRPPTADRVEELAARAARETG